MKTALITGVSGFVGKHLCDYLKSKGHDVYGFDLDWFGENFFKVDITNFEDVFDVVNKVRPDYIFHLAGFSSVAKSFENPELTRKINVEGTRNLFDAVVKAKLNPRILIVSSADVYGNCKISPINEGCKLNPLSPYAKSRVEQENLCKDYRLYIVISRSFPHTGPGQMPIAVCSSFAKQVAETEKKEKGVINVGNLGVVRDFTDVRDIVKAYLLALEKCKPGIYNICSGRGVLLKDMLNKLISFSTTKIDIKQDKSRIRKKDIISLVGDNTKFCKTTGWKPEIEFDNTLKDLLEFWRAQ